MKYRTTLIIAVLALVSTLFLSGCGENEIYMCPSGAMAGDQELTGNDVFICPDGTYAETKDECSYPLEQSVDQRTAEDNAMKFIKGYVSAHGWTPNVVSVNSGNGSYYAQVVISKHDEEPFETTLEIDGKTGSVSCESGCTYLE
ncbi:MAG: hypothetical protein ACLFTH_03580 [Candidatus Woesearchaeota archaeon]